MRVIAGTARRTVLTVPPGSPARPFLEMARGALFNSLTPWLEDARVLDLFAGSGALGIEALSRGAARCCFVEQDPRCLTAIRDNLARCRIEERGRILAGRAEERLVSLAGPFDLILVDPPFAAGARWDESPEGRNVTAVTARLLAPGGRLVFRFEHEDATPPTWGGLALLRDRRYGRSRLCFYAVAGEAPPAL
jgi:16S rRNA (guanine966-N2)-methyltransferase